MTKKKNTGRAKKKQSKHIANKKSNVSKKKSFTIIKKYSRNELLLILLYSFVIVLSGYLLYKPATDYKLVYCDDNIFLQDYYYLNKDYDNIYTVFSKSMGTSYYRPMLNVSIIVDTQMSLEKQFPNVDPNLVNPRSITPEIFHRTNLIYHLLASLLVFIFFIKIGYDILPSFLFSLLVVVHPLLTPAAAWISGRNDSMITIFILLSFIFMKFYFEKDKVSQYIFYLLHIIFFGFALFTKEIAAFFPFVIFAYLFFFEKRKKHIFDSKYIALVIGEFIMGMIWYIMRYKAITGIYNPDTIGIDALPDTYLTIPALIGKFFLPIKMIALASYETFTIVTGLIFITAIVVYLIKSKKLDKDKAYFGLIWFVLLLFPTLLIRIVFVGDFFDYAEHRAYLVMVGLIIFIMEVLKVYKVDFKKPVPLAVMIIIFGLFTYKSYTYEKDFKDRKCFWSHMTEMYPYKSRGYLDLGKAYLVEDSLDTAEKLYKKGIERNPNNKNLFIDLAAVYLKKKDFNEAIKYANHAISLNPGNIIAYYNLAKAYFSLGKYQEAKLAYENACRTNRHVEWFKELGDTYFRLGEYNSAIQSYQKVLLANPRNYSALSNAGLAYYQIGKTKDAEASWLRIINSQIKMPQPYVNLIRLYLKTNQSQKANQILKLFKDRIGGALPPDLANYFKNKK